MTSPSKGSQRPALYFEGPNPTADMVLFRPALGGPEVLLIVRSFGAAACPGLPAFPGGFIDAIDGPSATHRPKESPEQAARRELLEETGLTAGMDVELQACGVWQAPWRDPRNSAQRFVQSHLFCGWVPEGFGPCPQSLDDAEPGKTAWIPVSALKNTLMAFDHGAMLSTCCERLGVQDPKARSWALERLAPQAGSGVETPTPLPTPRGR